jgi:pyruvate,water dikinase
MIETGLRGERFAAEEGLATARASADHELGRLEQRASMLEIAAIRALVGRCQETTRLRERMRVWVARALGAIRRVALDVDRRLRRLDPALEPDSAFFCTFDELLDALRTGRVDFGPVVRLRRAEHARNRARPDPPATFAGRPIPVVLDVPDGTHPRGIGASPGVVEGRARVVHSVHEATTALEPGEILVARTTDVGLTPLFLVAAGIVTELGGALSHAAIIAREYGVPAVVGIAGITSLLRTGERLRIDGTRGVVARLDLPDRRGRPLGP